ncbi:MAG TPA: hypothetical protein VGH34_05425 [Vicinamibacterales bacterium]
MRGQRSVIVVTALTSVLASAAVASAQTAPRLTQLEQAIACAPPTNNAGMAAKLHVLGAQDTMDRVLYGTGDLLVIDGGTGADVQIGERFYVRRANEFGGIPDGTAVTSAWVTIVAVNETTAIASIEHLCGAILRRDYLEAFVPPAAPSGSDHADDAGDPDFGAMGKIVIGSERRSIVGAGDFALIDRGTEQGVAAGSRFAVYRNVGQGLPLTSIGEAVVVSTGTTTALARITRSRDAIFVGDYVVPRK